MATTESTWTFERISGFDREGLLDLWRTLPAPDPAAMEGEFSPWVPPYFAEAFRGFLTSQGQDDWYGKAYTRGEGHNIWQIGPDVVRSLRFAWDIRPSGLDGGPALVMDYPAFDNPAGAWGLIDEVRELGPGSCSGSTRPTRRRRASRRSPIPRPGAPGTRSSACRARPARGSAWTTRRPRRADG